jgi:hypothetical protein
MSTVFFRRIKPAVLLLFCTAFIAGCPEKNDCIGDPTGPGCQQTPVTGQRILSIAPAIQQTAVWCWAASAEMIFRHYQLPNVNGFGNYQCGIVAAWFGTQGYPQCLNNCGLCQMPVGAMSNEYRVVTEYGVFIRNVGGASPVLGATLLFRALSAGEVQKEIDANRPVIVGIAPGGGFALPNASQHIAVLIGYDFDGTQPAVIVNDPFPFDIGPFATYSNPYILAGAVIVRPGQYRVPLAALQQQLQWANSITSIRRL